MREALDRLKKATALLDQVEQNEAFQQCPRAVIAKVFLAHATIKWAEARLYLLRGIEEEICEKP